MCRQCDPESSRRGTLAADLSNGENAAMLNEEASDSA